MCADNTYSTFALQLVLIPFIQNPIKESELKYYSGKTKRKPHGISNKVWKKAYSWAKKNKVLTIERGK